MTVLTQEELLEFERNLSLLPEANDYCSYMTEEQLNKLISLLSRSRENFQMEANHYKKERDAYKAQLSETEKVSEEKDRALQNKDRVIRQKNKQLTKQEKKINDLEEQLSEMKKLLYGNKQQRTKPSDKKSRGKGKDDKESNDNNDGNNISTAETTATSTPGGADRQVGEVECDGKTPQAPVTEDKSCEGGNSSSTGCTFNIENRPESYRTMKLSGITDIKEELERIVTEHKFDRSQLPKGAVITDRRVETFYTMKSYLICETIEKLRVKLPGKKSSLWMYIPKEGERCQLPVPGTKASPEFLRAIVYDHYLKRVTTGCIHRSLKDLGMQISKNTLRNWLRKGKKYIDRLIVKLREIALEKDSILNCDET